MKKLPAGLGLAILILLPVQADPNPMVGNWRASNGYTVHIPSGPQAFSLVFEDAQGKKITHPAQWTKVGTEFSWVDKQNTPHKATFDSHYKSPRIRDWNSAYPDSPAFWYKIPQASVR